MNVDPTRLLEITFDAVLVFDWASGRLTFWNRGAEKLYGWSHEEALGQLPQELLRTQHAGIREEIRNVLSRTGHWEGTLVQRARDGRLVTVDARWVLDRENSAVLEVNRDVTLASAELLQSVERARGEFIEQVAHQLRTPVTLLRGYLELLEQRRIEGPVDDDYLTALERLHESAEDMHAVSERLIAAARVDLGGEAAGLPRCNLVEVARQAISEASDTERTIERVAYSGPEDIPVAADPAHLELLVRELIVTACRRAEGGQVGAELARRGAVASLVVTVGSLATGPADGHGASLEFPRRIAKLYGGEVVSHREGDKLHFELKLPVAN